MPTTIYDLFKYAELTLRGQVKWGQKISRSECGFYIVALSDTYDYLYSNIKPNFEVSEIAKWLEVVKSGGKNLLLDNQIATIKGVCERLESLWLTDETILYIGKAGPSKARTVGKRLKEYYDTKFGSDGKHAGGHWINALSNITSLNIFYADYLGQDINEKEEQMILYFMGNVSDETRNRLFDKENCYPFANKELHRKSLGTKIRKLHGFKNQTIDCGSKWKKEL